MSQIAYCGLDCGRCPVYLATVQGDREKQAQLALEYSTEECAYAPEDMVCMGCRTQRLSRKLCGACPIRSCAGGRDIVNCGYCSQYPCETIEAQLTADHKGRKALERIAGKRTAKV